MIFLLFLFYFIIFGIALTFRDYLKIINYLHFILTETNKNLGLDIPIRYELPVNLHGFFYHLGKEMDRLMLTKYGKNYFLLDEYRKHLRLHWIRLDLLSRYLPYTTKYTKYIFFIFNKVFYCIGPVHVYSYMGDVILFVICFTIVLTVILILMEKISHMKLRDEF